MANPCEELSYITDFLENGITLTNSEGLLCCPDCEIPINGGTFSLYAIGSADSMINLITELSSEIGQNLLEIGCCLNGVAPFGIGGSGVD